MTLSHICILFFFQKIDFGLVKERLCFVEEDDRGHTPKNQGGVPIPGQYPIIQQSRVVRHGVHGSRNGKAIETPHRNHVNSIKLYQRDDDTTRRK